MGESGPGGNLHRRGAIVRAVGKAHLMVTHRLRLFNSLLIPGTIFGNTALENWVGLSLIYVKTIQIRNDWILRPSTLNGVDCFQYNLTRGAGDGGGFRSREAL